MGWRRRNFHEYVLTFTHSANNTNERTNAPDRTTLKSSAEIMKKALTQTQTLRAGCSKGEPEIFAPGDAGRQNLISWRWSLPYLQIQFGENRCMQFRVIVVTDPQTHAARPPARPLQTHPQTGLITIHCIAQCNYY